MCPTCRSTPIQELADLGDVSRRTVRYYVQEGLLPAPLGIGRGRHYGPEHLDRLLQVKALQSAGRSLDDIRAVLRHRAGRVARRLARTQADTSALTPALRHPGSSARSGAGSNWRPVSNSTSRVTSHCPVLSACKSSPSGVVCISLSVHPMRTIMPVKDHRRLLPPAGSTRTRTRTPFRSKACTCARRSRERTPASRSRSATAIVKRSPSRRSMCFRWTKVRLSAASKPW